MNLFLDFGGTKLRFALSDNYKTLDNTSIYPSIQNYSEVMEFIRSKKDEITQGNPLEFISGGIAGVVQDNNLLDAPHLTDWVNKPIAQDLQDIFQAKEIILKNDAAMAALAEAVAGAGRDFGIVSYITISTGVGGARVVNKYLDEAYFGFEPGHQIINVIDGNPLSFEDLASGTGIEKRYGKPASEITDPQTWQEVEKYIAYGLNNIVMTWSPEIIVLGGGLINNNAVNIETIKAQLSELLKVFPKSPEIRKTELGEEVGLFGALFNLKNKNG